MATAEVIRQNIRQNQERDLAQQMNNYGGQSEVQELPNGFPSSSNDAALAAYLKETRDSSQEYAKLRTEEARQQWEAIAADNFRRTQSTANELKAKAAVETMNRAITERSEGERLFSELDATLRSTPTDNLQGNAEDAYRIPMDKLKTLANTGQKLFNLTGQDIFAPQEPQLNPQPQARPDTFPDGSLYQLQNLPDGNVEVRLITGEVFKGDPISVTQQMAKAQVNTKRWAQQQRAQAQQSQQAEPIQLNQPTAQTAVQPTEQNSIADYWAERQATALAQQFGFSDKNEMLQWGENINQKMQTIQQYENERLASQFYQACPEFPGTPEAIDAITNIVESQRWDWTADNLQAAHALAIQRQMYKPVPPETEQQPARPTPPPMLRGGSPEVSQAALSPYDMPLSDLRKAAIKQELEKK